MSSITLASLQPLLAPLASEVYSMVVYPELQKLAASANSPDLKVAADALLVAIDTIAKAEIAKA